MKNFFFGVLTLLMLTMFANTVNAQPGDPCDPDTGTVSEWTLSASASTISSGQSVTITANRVTPLGSGQNNTTASITVNGDSGNATCISGSPSTITKSIHCTSNSFVVGSFTLTANCGGSTRSKKIYISAITGGHTGVNNFVYVEVTP